MPDLSNLPPEMQARIAQIMRTGQHPETPHQSAIAQPDPTPTPEPSRPLNLMDQILAIRQEVQLLREELSNSRQGQVAQGQVIEAVGNAVGQMYSMLQQQELYQQQQAATRATYSNQFQQGQAEDTDF